MPRKHKTTKNRKTHRSQQLNVKKITGLSQKSTAVICSIWLFLHETFIWSSLHE